MKTSHFEAILLKSINREETNLRKIQKYNFAIFYISYNLVHLNI